MSSSLICSSQASTPCASAASKVTPSTPGAPLFSLASTCAWRGASILQTWTYRPQQRQGGITPMGSFIPAGRVDLGGILSHTEVGPRRSREADRLRHALLRGNVSDDL